MSNKKKNPTIKFISCIVAKAINLFISVEVHIRIDASIAPKNISPSIKWIKEECLNKKLKYIKQNKAVFTKYPLKKIEKPVGASTWTFVNQ